MQIKSWKHLSKANSAQVCNDMILTRRGLLDIMWRGINMHLLTHNHPFPLEMPCHRFKFLVMNFYFQVWSFIFYSPTKEPQNQKKTTEEPTTLFRWKCSCHRAIPPLVLDLPFANVINAPAMHFSKLEQTKPTGGELKGAGVVEKPSIFDLRQLPRIQAPVTWPTAPVSRHATLQPSQGGVVRCCG